jgi:hypothetical protein
MSKFWGRQACCINLPSVNQNNLATNHKLWLSKTCTKHLLIDYIKKTYTPTTEMLVVQLLLGKDTGLKDNEGHTSLRWAAQKGLLLKRKDVDLNFLDSGKFDRPELPTITWDFNIQELPEITWDFKTQELPAITWDFKTQELLEITWDFETQELPAIT